MFQRVPSAFTKADSDILPIHPTSNPTIDNTFVGTWLVLLYMIDTLKFRLINLPVLYTKHN